MVSLQGVVSRLTDIYSFGVLLWELACGESPYPYAIYEDTPGVKKDSDAVLNNKRADFFTGSRLSLCGGLPPELDRFLREAVQPDVQLRQSAFPAGRRIVEHAWHMSCHGYLANPFYWPVQGKLLYDNNFVLYRTAEYQDSPMAVGYCRWDGFFSGNVGVGWNAQPVSFTDPNFCRRVKSANYHSP
jgi:serine/threonine protein kinase